MSKIDFLEYKEKIISALNNNSAALGINESVTLLDGFLNLSTQKQLPGIVIGGPSIPAVVLVGNSGRIYIFALKALIKDLEI